MKVPISWLKEYVTFDDTIQGLSDKLTFSGIEVEGIETIGAIPAGVIVGEIKTCEKHPDADRLSVCTVCDGADEYQVVCGAPNARKGLKSAFAPVGTQLAADFKIKKAKIRGVASFGMLCAEDELGLSGSHEGIMELAADAEPGTALADLLPPPETVFDLEITPNRPDCLSIIGIAREVAVLYGTELNLPSAVLPAGEDRVSDLASVSVSAPDLCPRYTARILTGVQVKPSPDWMQQRLQQSGIRPINNLVDITNYVLLETGHPLHAFDFDLLAGGTINVRRAAQGETIHTLDDIERKLTADMPVIADAEKPVAVAGVMGGAGSEIRPETSRVLLESACFDPAAVRATSKALGLVTDSSYRFSRGVDTHGVEWAGARAAQLMTELAEAVPAEGLIDVHPEPQQPRSISLNWSDLYSLIGLEIDTQRVSELFEALGLTVADSSEKTITVSVPSLRRDLERDVDLIEEVARIHGLDRIPVPSPVARIVPDTHSRHFEATQQCRTRLTALGLFEAMHYSLVAPELLDTMREPAAQRITMPHPISQDQSVLRTSLLPQMAETLGRNKSRQIAEAALFEIGKTFHLEDEQTTEQERLSLGMYGTVAGDSSDEALFLALKGVVEHLCAALHVETCTFTPAEQPALEPGRAVEVHLDGNRIGVMGLLHRKTAENWRFAEPVALAELDLSSLTARYDTIRPVTNPNIYPSISRDMALLAPENLTHEDIMQVIENAAPKELEKVVLFDIFRGKSVGDGVKSMAYSLTYRADDRTLTDEDANGYHDRIKAAVRKQLNIEIREG